MSKNRFLFLFVFVLVAIQVVGAPRQKFNFNTQWLLQIGDVADASQIRFDDSQWKRVTLPHAFNEDEAFQRDIHQLTDTIVWYRKHFVLPKTVKGRKVFVEFEGARQGIDVYVNGQKVGSHDNGVMAFGLDLTPYVKEGKENVIACRIDNNWEFRERTTNVKYQWSDRNFNANYGGLPKNVWLHITDQLYQTLPLYSNLGTTGTYVYARDIQVKSHQAMIHAESEVKNETHKAQDVVLQVEILDRDGHQIALFEGEPSTIAVGSKAIVSAEKAVSGLHFWSWGYGYLYQVKTRLVVGTIAAKGKKRMIVDEVTTTTGFRKTRFGEGKFWLNDRVLQLKGFAQRTSNEWPAVGMSVPAWLSDYSNGLIVEGNGNLVRWMHVTPWKQDVESCDRVGLIQAMPAGDAEKDSKGVQWEQRKRLMRDAIIYNRNNPSIIFYEGGNESISRDHMLELISIRDSFDLFGGRAIGSREMLDIREAEYGGEMLYINKSAHSPMWAMEYCRDEGLRRYWDELSYPYHREGTGKPEYHSTVTNQKKKIDPRPYNHNQDVFARENVIRWYDYFRERPGTGRRTSTGGAKIIFSDTNTHFRGEMNYRMSGDVDPMRIPKDSWYAHQVMWDGWVDIENPRVYIIGHWNYENGDSLGRPVQKPIMIVGNTDSVSLTLNGRNIPIVKHEFEFLFTSDTVAFESGSLVAIGYNNGKAVARYELQTAGHPAALKLTVVDRPGQWKADGADLQLVQVEVVDDQGRRCPLANDTVRFALSGPAEWRGGIATGRDNCILSSTLPVECGVNRVLLRSTTVAGAVILRAEAKGFAPVEMPLQTQKVDISDLSTFIPAAELKGRLGRGETPTTPSYTDCALDVAIVSATAGCNQETAANSYDDNELSEWKNDGQAKTAWITYRLERRAVIDDLCLKLTGWRMRSYNLEVYARVPGKVDDKGQPVKQLVWSGKTPMSLGYIHLPLKPVLSNEYTILVQGAASEQDAFGGIVEVAAAAAGELDLYKAKDGDKPRMELRIVEAEFKETFR